MYKKRMIQKNVSCQPAKKKEAPQTAVMDDMAQIHDVDAQISSLMT